MTAEIFSCSLSTGLTPVGPLGLAKYLAYLARTCLRAPFTFLSFCIYCCTAAAAKFAIAPKSPTRSEGPPATISLKQISRRVHCCFCAGSLSAFVPYCFVRLARVRSCVVTQDAIVL